MERLLIGIGQAGIDIVENISRDISLETAAIDLDRYSLHAADVDHSVFVKETEALDASGLNIDHEIDINSIEHVKELIEPYDGLYIISALGGRAGGVIVPAVAKTALEMGLQVHGKIILPFEEEESKRQIAELYLDNIRDLFTTLDIYDNHEYVEKADEEVTLDSLYSLHSIFEEINRDIKREIQQDILYEA
ncbi:MAG: hypothetical protein SVU32_00315 [Candidatus Nanohaloarchaea archaeon]|nr:hypothetical protein [Candidatus Nanohaloarchaea archaeon]